MKKLTRKALLAIITASMMLSILVQSGAINAAPTASEVIRVNSDGELASVATSGSGTSSSPYVIENLNIDATGHDAGIYIGNTTKHLIIRDCTVVGATYVIDHYGQGDAIALYNVRNCLVEDNHCSGSRHGISLYASTGNTVSGNNCSDNSNHGIQLFSSNSNTISGNRCGDDGNYGIYLYSSSDNIITKNRCLSDHYGIYIYSSSDRNLIYGNLLANNNGASAVYSSSHVQAFDSCSNYWNTTTCGNLWDDLSAPDADSDGVVDVPYAINGGSNIDRYPLNIDLDITTPASLTTTIGSSVTVSGTAVDGFGITAITWHNAASGASGICSGTSSWTTCVSLVSGSNLITITLTDNAGLEITDDVTVLCDNQAPTIELSLDEEGVDIASPIVITFSEPMDPDLVDIRIDGVEGTVTWNGSVATYSPSSLAYNEEYNLSVTGRDSAGNVIDRTWAFNTTKVGDLEGYLVDEEGNMLFNTTVSLSSGLMTTSDAFGHFVFKNVTEGSYILTVSRDGYGTITKNVTVSANEATKLGELVASPSAPSGGSAPPASDNTMLVIIAVIAVAAVAALVVLYIRKRR